LQLIADSVVSGQRTTRQLQLQFSPGVARIFTVRHYESKTAIFSPNHGQLTPDRSQTLTNERLSDIAIQRELGSLPGWSRRGDVITKTFQFRNFLTGIDFVNAVAKAAEAADHHPDIDIRYTKIICSLSTHSAGGITQKDLDLAKKIERAQEE
jgi:4a-hydroxytetrahydrobiopterin dehydratase